MTARSATRPAAVPRPPGYTEPAFVEVMGLATAVRRSGAGEPVLFLHGAGLTRVWLPIHARLSAHCDLIAPEHPGFGETPMPAHFRGMRDAVLHYDALLDVLGLDTVHVVGYSLGGWIAAELAITCPRRLASLTLAAPMGLRAEWGEIPDIFMLSPAEVMARLFEEPSARASMPVPDPTDLSEVAQAYGEATAFARLAWTPRYDVALEHYLPLRVGCPSQVILPGRDRLVPAAIGRRYAELLDCPLHEVPGTGHALIVERPDEVARFVLALVGASH